MNCEIISYFNNSNERISDLISCSIFIEFCLFISLNFNSGGAIYINTNNMNLNCKFTSFLKCITTNQGGGIYFYCLTGYSSINYICSNECYTNDGVYYQFCIISTENNKIN